ncbi:8436_t:CDS:2 [Acaulospora morrowiae]|uniref:8436_t:CDS:1 n=1 Tax=Acaulospora morrowiae TaxID=94023 RepID=A0A9N9DRE1_9GLOM|nr:8436_t:CDS:2 [Acaulospora morrowiae]
MHSQNVLSEGTSLGDATVAAKPFLEFVNTIIEVSKATLEAYGKSQYNKKTCGVLLTRVEFAQCAVKALIRNKEDHVEDFCSQDYYQSFAKFTYVMKKIRKFVEDISQLSQFKRFTSSQSVKDMLRAILEDFDTRSSELRLNIVVNTEKDMKVLDDDLEQMKELEISNGVEVNRGSVIKRRYKGIEVACKKVNIVKDDEAQAKRFKTRAKILEKLHLCESIVRFYGISKSGNDDYMVYEWAERQSLKEVYENHKLSLCKKVSIALDICQGLVFLNAIGVYHQDIRCENILMTAKWKPKIANFTFAKEVKEINRQSSLNWMAPEKMMEYPYTPGCEIFSFGMLLWELKYEKIPYKGKDTIELFDHVTSGKREELNINLSPREDDQKYAEIIRKAWEHDPTLRIELASLLDEIQKLNVCCKYDESLNIARMPQSNTIRKHGREYNLGSI